MVLSQSCSFKVLDKCNNDELSSYCWASPRKCLSRLSMLSLVWSYDLLSSGDVISSCQVLDFGYASFLQDERTSLGETLGLKVVVVVCRPVRCEHFAVAFSARSSRDRRTCKIPTVVSSRMCISAIHCFVSSAGVDFTNRKSLNLWSSDPVISTLSVP